MQKGKKFTPTPKPTLESVLDWAEVPYNTDRVRQMCHCPLNHDSGDRTPSLSINTERQVWKCQSCGEGGDSWTMIMKKAGVDFAGACRIAASESFTTGDARGGDEPLLGFSFSGPRGSTGSARPRPGQPAFVPSWNRQQG